MNVGDHGTGIAARIAAALRPIQVAPIAFGECLTVAFVDGVGLVPGGNLQIPFDPHERPDAGIEYEHVHALADGQNEHRG